MCKQCKLIFFQNKEWPRTYKHFLKATFLVSGDPEIDIFQRKLKFDICMITILSVYYG